MKFKKIHLFYYYKKAGGVMICSPSIQFAALFKVQTAVAGNRQITRGILQLLIEQVAARIEISYAG
jgi:hypothetical protein